MAYNNVSHRPFQARSSRHLSERADEVTLHDLLSTVLGRRDVVMVGDWNEQKCDFDLIRSDAVAALEQLSWGEIVDQFGAVDLVPGTVLAATATVRA